MIQRRFLKKYFQVKQAIGKYALNFMLTQGHKITAFVCRPIYTAQLLPKTVACNLLTNCAVHVNQAHNYIGYVVVGELCA